MVVLSKTMSSMLAPGRPFVFRMGEIIWRDKFTEIPAQAYNQVVQGRFQVSSVVN